MFYYVERVVSWMLNSLKAFDAIVYGSLR
jgi:hypothetical protein